MNFNVGTFVRVRPRVVLLMVYDGFCPSVCMSAALPPVASSPFLSRAEYTFLKKENRLTRDDIHPFCSVSMQAPHKLMSEIENREIFKFISLSRTHFPSDMSKSECQINLSSLGRKKFTPITVGK